MGAWRGGWVPGFISLGGIPTAGISGLNGRTFSGCSHLFSRGLCFLLGEGTLSPLRWQVHLPRDSRPELQPPRLTLSPVFTWEPGMDFTPSPFHEKYLLVISVFRTVCAS